ENHALDVKNALHNLKHTGIAPTFPDTLWKKILLDEAVDFDEINAFFFSTKLELDPTPTVSSAVVWFRCFDKYSEAVETVFPFRRNELRTYRQHIDDLFSAKVESSQARVIAYDIAARKVVASSRGILF
ncbi:hypothetical protein BDZ89DRAFT_903805, partial [Hymenopellis radicata]